MRKILALMPITLIFVFCLFVPNQAFANHHYRHHFYRRYHKHYYHKHYYHKYYAYKHDTKLSNNDTDVYVNRIPSGRSNFIETVTVIRPVRYTHYNIRTVVETPSIKYPHNKVLIITGSGFFARKEDIEGANQSVNVAERYEGFTAHNNKSDLIRLFRSTIHQTVDPTVTPWCAAFVNAMLSILNIKGTNSLAAGSFTKWGRETIVPKKNDIVLLKFNRKTVLNGISHVAFYLDTVKIKGIKYVKVLGGNQKHSVRVSYYPIKYVVQYRTIG